MHLLSDFCNRLSQASASKLKRVIVKNSKLVINILFILYKLGFILYFTEKNYKFVLVGLKHTMSGPAVRGLVSLSKPSLKIYLKCKNVQNFSFNNIFGLNGFMLLSTSRGTLLLDVECILNKSGGKPLIAVY